MPEYAEDDTVAPQAAREFFAGVFFGWVGEDVWTSMGECFPDDSVLGGYIDTMISNGADEDWTALEATMVNIETLLTVDMESCRDWDDVWSAW